MSSRTEAVAELKKGLYLMKQALMPVPTYPDPSQAGGPPAPPPGPPQGVPQGSPPGDPAMMQGAPPADPGTAQPQPGAPPQDMPQQPAVPSDMAAIMDQVIQKTEELHRIFEERSRQQDAQIAEMKHELDKERTVRAERSKVINTMLPAL